VTPWMKMYWGDFLSTNMPLTMAEMGAYVRLMGNYWRSGQLPSEAAPGALLRRCYTICGAESKSDRAAVQKVLQECFVKQGDTYVHPQLDEAIAIAVRSREQKIEQGRKGGLASARHRAASGQPEGQATLKQPELASESESASRGTQQQEQGSHESVGEDIFEQELGYLVSKHIPESTAKRQLDLLAKQYSKEDIAEAVTITMVKDPEKPLAYLAGILRNKANGTIYQLGEV
jgi:uncharacterized protein YdaU (DUF1376 family)